MNPASRASAAWYERFLDHMAPTHCAKSCLPRCGPIQRAQFTQMSLRVRAFYRVACTAIGPFLLTPSHA